MAKLVIDLSNTADVLYARMFLANFEVPAAGATQPLTGLDNMPEEVDEMEPEMMEEELTADEPEEDLLGDLLGDEPEEEPGVSVDDMKAAFKSLATKKTKEVAMGLVKKVFAKLGVDKIEAIPEDKRETFINILTAAASK